MRRGDDDQKRKVVIRGSRKENLSKSGYVNILFQKNHTVPQIKNTTYVFESKEPSKIRKWNSPGGGAEVVAACCGLGYTVDGTRPEPFSMNPSMMYTRSAYYLLYAYTVLVDRQTRPARAF